MLSAIVNKEGLAQDISVTKSLTPGMDEQAIKAVSKRKFSPAAKDGDPVAVKIAIQVDFHLYK